MANSITKRSVKLLRQHRNEIATRCDLWLQQARILLADALRTEIHPGAPRDLAVLEERVLLSATPIVEAMELTDAPQTDQLVVEQDGVATQTDDSLQQATVTVTQTADVVNGDTRSTADLTDGGDGGDGISLREAILAANADSDVDTIVLGPGTYVLSIDGDDDDALGGDLDLTEDLVIQGAGVGTTVIDASGIAGGDRVFHARNGATISIQGLTITGGLGEEGAGLLIEQTSAVSLVDVAVVDNDSGSNDGGGISNRQGTLEMVDVTIADNSASGQKGGGIFNTGTATLERVTVSGNSAKDGGGGYCGGSDDSTFTNVTISGNSASDKGGGLYLKEQVEILHSTIVFNTAETGAGIEEAGETVSLKNSILAHNFRHDGTTPSNVAGTIFSQGYNIDSDGTANLSAAGDQSNIDPVLSATLAFHGGKVKTHALLSQSPAIDVAGLTGAPPVDQRNVTRDATPDIGAFEYIATQLASSEERRINANTANIQETSSKNRGSTQSVAMADDGSYVVVWSHESSSGTGWDVFAQRFDRFARERSDEVQVNQQSANDQRWANVAMDAAGNFVVTWTSQSQDGNGQGVYARRFDASGQALASEFRVNDTTAGDQSISSISMNRASGDFAIVWSHENLLDKKLLGRRYDADGNPVGSSEVVIASDGLAEIDPVVSMRDDGELVVAWEKSGNIHWKRYDADWNSMVGEVAVASGPLTTAEGPSVAFLADGSVVVAWTQDRDVMMRRFDDDGIPVSAADRVNTTTLATQMSPSITANSDGTFIIVWEGKGQDDPNGVYLQKYNSDGSTNGDETRVNTTTPSHQCMASLTGTDLDNFVVVWSGSGAVGDEGVFAKQFGTAPSFPPTVIASQTFQVVEFSANGTAVGTIEANDPDSDPADLQWTINSGNAAGAFSIDTLTGELVVADASQLNSALVSTYMLEVTVSDGFESSWAETVTVNVTNAPPTDLTLSDSLVAGKKVGAIVGTLVSIDVTKNDSHAYAVDDARFEIIGNQLQLKADEMIDATVEPSVTVQVQTTDSAGNAYAETFVLTVTHPPTVTVSQTLQVMEQSPNGTSVGYVLATDPDSDDSVLQWSIVDGNAGGIFTIDAGTGEITVADSSHLDFTTAANHSLQIAVSDDMSTSDVETVAIQVSNAPPTDVALDGSLLTGSRAGAVVGTLSSSDPTTMESHSYTVDDRRFEVVGDQLQLKADEVVEYADEPTVTLQIQSTDSAGNRFTKSFVVEVTKSDVATVHLTTTIVESGLGGFTDAQAGAEYSSKDRAQSDVSPEDASSEASGDKADDGEAGADEGIGSELLVGVVESQIQMNHGVASKTGIADSLGSLVPQPFGSSNSGGREGGDSRALAFDPYKDFATRSMSTSAERDATNIAQESADAGARLERSLNHVQQVMVQPQLWQAIDSMNKDVHQSVASMPLKVGATATTTAGITAGYVVWILRSGVLVSSAFAHLPMWRFMDPLAILNATGVDEEEDAESLQSIVAEEDSAVTDDQEESISNGDVH